MRQGWWKWTVNEDPAPRSRYSNEPFATRASASRQRSLSGVSTHLISALYRHAREKKRGSSVGPTTRRRTKERRKGRERKRNSRGGGANETRRGPRKGNPQLIDQEIKSAKEPFRLRGGQRRPGLTLQRKYQISASRKTKNDAKR